MAHFIPNMCRRALCQHQLAVTSTVDLWPFLCNTKTRLKISKWLIRLNADVVCPLLLFFFCFFFPQRCTCWRMPDCSDQEHRQSCDSQTLQCPCPRLSASFCWLAITSARLFLPVSYDVLWPCSGSRTVTVLSPPRHLIDTLFPVTCAHSAELQCVCNAGDHVNNDGGPAVIVRSSLIWKCHLPSNSRQHCGHFFFLHFQNRTKNVREALKPLETTLLKVSGYGDKPKACMSVV